MSVIDQDSPRVADRQSMPASGPSAAGDAQPAVTGVTATRDEVLESARRAKVAAAAVALLPRSVKDAALIAMADALLDRRVEILAANAIDVRAAQAAGTPDSLVDR
jgi:glutamate-5-semialdehyde dehydrogenase